MDIIKNQEGNKLSVSVTGRLDTTTAPQLEEEIRSSIDGVEELVFDFSDLEYISSAGLRVLLSTQKIMNKQGSMEVIGVNEIVMEVFEVTGFSDILTIKS